MTEPHLTVLAALSRCRGEGGLSHANAFMCSRNDFVLMRRSLGLVSVTRPPRPDRSTKLASSTGPQTTSALCLSRNSRVNVVVVDARGCESTLKSIPASTSTMGTADWTTGSVIVAWPIVELLCLRRVICIEGGVIQRGCRLNLRSI